MYNLFQKSKGFIIAIVILLIGFIVYNVYFKAPSSSATLTSSATTADGSSSEGSVEQDFVNQLLALNSLKFDTSLFQNPLFQNLQDFSTTLDPEPSGRPNPFAPLGNVSIVTGTSSSDFLPFSQSGTSSASNASSTINGTSSKKI